MMRKQTKVAAVLSAAALLALGASMTSFAATKGWTQEEGDWYYLDSNGDKVTESWKKSGSNYYWLDENGNLAKSQLVKNDENVYYVDENGVRVVNQWVSVENTDSEQVNNKDVDVLWYYMGSSGRAYKSDEGEPKSSTIGGKKYFFDSEGRMVSGWHKNVNDTYYLGDENQGYAHVGWQYLEIEESIASIYDNEEAWFYFSSAGKMYKNSRKYLSNAYYAFDGNGVMLGDWQKATDKGDDAIDSSKISVYDKIKLESGSSSFYNIESGAQGSGWVYTYENGEESGDKKWFYLVSSKQNQVFNAGGLDSGVFGKPYDETENRWSIVGGEVKIQPYSGGVASGNPKYNVAAKIIKSKTYLFADNGAMLTGVYYFETPVVCNGGEKLDTGFYYFNTTTAAEGRMATGKTVVNQDGENYTYYFEKKGSAVVGRVKDGCLYGMNGVRVEARDGNPYQAVTISELLKDDSGKKMTINSKEYTKGTVIVTSAGKLRNSGTATIDEIVYTIKDGVVEDAAYKGAKKGDPKPSFEEKE